MTPTEPTNLPPFDESAWPTRTLRSADPPLCDHLEEPPPTRTDPGVWCHRPASWWGAGRGKWAGRLVFTCAEHRGMLPPPEDGWGDGPDQTDP